MFREWWPKAWEQRLRTLDIARLAWSRRETGRWSAWAKPVSDQHP